MPGEETFVGNRPLTKAQKLGWKCERVQMEVYSEFFYVIRNIISAFAIRCAFLTSVNMISR